MWHHDRVPANLVWTREEIILAMDLYVREGGLDGRTLPSDSTESVRRLSGILNRLGAYPAELRGATYRSPNAVALKLLNLRAVQTDGAEGMPAHSQADAAAWRDYVDDLPRLHSEAEAIRTRLNDGSIQPASAVATVEDVEIEEQHTEAYLVDPGPPRAAQRAEARLVQSYRSYMDRQGVLVRRKRYKPAGEVQPIYSDIWVEARSALIEAKNSDDRNAVRQAIGQLYDYRRFHSQPVHLAVLLPYRPNADRLELLRSAAVEAVWPHRNGFRDTAEGLFV